MIWLTDRVWFDDAPGEVEEALVTWLDVTVDGASAIVRGQWHALRLTIEEPVEARFEVERLGKQSRANAKQAMLTRLRFTLPLARITEGRVRMEVIPVTP